MTLQAGIVGLPNVGKSTLYNAVSNCAKAQAGNYRFCTIEPNVGLVNVPDPRLNKLSELVLHPKKASIPKVMKIKKAPSLGLLVIQTIHKNKSSSARLRRFALLLEQLII